MDTGTSEICMIEVSSSWDGDSSVPRDLPEQIPDDGDIGAVTADGACGSRRWHSAIIARGGTAIIPIRRNGRPWKEEPSREGAQRQRTTRH